MATTQVDSTAALSLALKQAHAGDTILLAPGTYSGASFSGLSFASGVTIASADPAHQAVVTNFNMNNCQGLTFSNLEMFAKAPANFAFVIRNSQDIAFDHVNVHGSLDGDAGNDASGIQVLNSSGVSVTNSEFQQLARGMAIGTTSNLTVADNHVHHVRSDGFDFAEVSYARITGNVLSDFSPAAGDHPDAIQFWTQGTTTPSHDVEISGNLIMRGEGASTQGIFMGDEVGTLPYERITISGNMIVGTGLNALRIYGGKDLTITDNQLVTFAGQDKVYILLQLVDGATVTGNDAVSFGYDRVTNLVQSGNHTTTAVGDAGIGSLKAWMAAHPEDSFALSSSGTSTPTTTGDVGDNTLAGEGSANIIYGGAGNDTITDAGGSNYLRGDDGADRVVGGSGFDDINGNAGDDTAYGGLGDDWVVGGKDQDVLGGQEGADRVYGNLGADDCDGGEGSDTVRGGQQDDTLTGGAGNDWLSGDRDSDVLTGGAGADVFHTFGEAGVDRVLDFSVAEGDRVQLDPGTTYSVAQVGADTVITMGGGGQMTLVGVTMSSLPAGWLFAA